MMARHGTEVNVMATLTIEQRQRGEVTILDLEGKLTLGEGAAAFRERVRSLLADGHKKVLVNLAGVSYVDSSGVGELVSAYATANRSEAKLKLSNLTQSVADLLQLTKLLTVFEVFEDTEAAIESFG
jgi:anti-sigma B factor antagonist